MTIRSGSGGDPEGTAEKIRARDGGGASAPPPNGSEKTSDWSDERRAAQAARARAQAEQRRAEGKRVGRPPKGAKPEQEPITDDERRMVGYMFGTAWAMLGPFVKLSALDDAEQFRLGSAAAPVIRKYLPMLGDWALEINLTMVVVALVQAKREQWRRENGEETFELPGMGDHLSGFGVDRTGEPVRRGSEEKGRGRDGIDRIEPPATGSGIEKHDPRRDSGAGKKVDGGGIGSGAGEK